MVGGAVVTQEYADEIGADLYAKDAMEAVAKIKKLLEAKTLSPALPVREREGMSAPFFCFATT